MARITEMGLFFLFSLASAATALALPSSAPPSKRGLAYGPKDGATFCADVALVNTTRVPWAYSWSLLPPAAGCPGVGGALEFTPMVWGRSSVGRTPFSPAQHLLGFNEPNVAKQSNLSPAEAAGLWPQLVATATQHGLALLAPAPASGHDVAWLTQFFANCSHASLASITAIPAHFYGCQVPALKAWLGALKAFGKPIWVTEFNCGNGMRNASAAEHLAWMKEALPVLDGDEGVARYAWMASRDVHIPGAALFTGTPDAPRLTELGALYMGVGVSEGRGQW